MIVLLKIRNTTRMPVFTSSIYHCPVEKWAKVRKKPDILRGCDWTHEKMFNLISDWLIPQWIPFYIQ